MAFIIAIPLRVLFGLVLYKLRKYSTLTYLLGILPYSIFFWFSLEDKDFWGHYRMAAIIGTLISLLIWKTIEWSNEKEKIY